MINRSVLGRRLAAVVVVTVAVLLVRYLSSVFDDRTNYRAGKFGSEVVVNMDISRVVVDRDPLRPWPVQATWVHFMNHSTPADVGKLCGDRSRDIPGGGLSQLRVRPYATAEKPLRPYLLIQDVECAQFVSAKSIQSLDVSTGEPPRRYDEDGHEIRTDYKGPAVAYHQNMTLEEVRSNIFAKYGNRPMIMPQEVEGTAWSVEFSKDGFPTQYGVLRPHPEGVTEVTIAGRPHYLCGKYPQIKDHSYVHLLDVYGYDPRNNTFTKSGCSVPLVLR
jgi:hypothetical protein